MKNFASGLNKKKKILIFGAGFSGKYIANEMRSIGFEALTSSRTFKNDQWSFVYDSNDDLLPPDKLFKNVTHVLSCIPPNKDGTDPLLSKLENKLLELDLEWAGYLSTTGVYGNTFGEWVSESNPVNPIQERSKRRLLCEHEWINSSLPTQIFRLPGIYGPGRSTLDSILKNNVKVIFKEHQVFSRVHVADIANAIIYLIKNKNNLNFHKIINIADNNPSSQIEVIRYAYQLLKMEMPEPLNFEEAKNNLSPIALSFWEENRRVSNSLLCNELGYNLIYKDYKSGLKNCLKHINLINKN
tara:strand:- start:104 stop:1000 length:897 start_codon:yes stop_codon:yes gene_type:complete